MKRTIVFALCIMLAVAVFGCSKKTQEPAEPEKIAMETTTASPSEFSSGEDLVRAYIKLIENKDVEGLKNLALTVDELPGAAQSSRGPMERWMEYFSHMKRLFLTNNQDLLGHKLNFLSFQPGKEIKVGPKATVFRGSKVLVETENKKRVALEINFIVRRDNKWKLLFLKYFDPNASAEDDSGPKEGAAMDVSGTKTQFQIKVKKADSGKDEKPADPADENQGMDELKKNVRGIIRISFYRPYLDTPDFFRRQQTSFASRCMDEKTQLLSPNDYKYLSSWNFLFKM